jgi:alkylhydroperoxidase/carboxymuconolactone decarboxylase family protein YurZ
MARPGHARGPSLLGRTYLAVLAALGRESGIAFHAASARKAGASREELISAILVGLPAAGQVVIGSLPAALDAFDRG